MVNQDAEPRSSWNHNQIKTGVVGVWKHARFLCMCAQTLRPLVGLSSDAQKLALLRDVARLAADAPSGAFPRSEAAWLAITAWNRGCHHARFCRVAEARPFMEAALALLPACPDLQQQHGEVRSCQLLSQTQQHTCRVCPLQQAATEGLARMHVC